MFKNRTIIARIIVLNNDIINGASPVLIVDLSSSKTLSFIQFKLFSHD
ncbi:MAG: hypothetical protein ACEY3E_03225 [Candidatus Tisiphia sp.]